MFFARSLSRRAESQSSGRDPPRNNGERSKRSCTKQALALVPQEIQQQLDTFYLCANDAGKPSANFLPSTLKKIVVQQDDSPDRGGGLCGAEGEGASTSQIGFGHRFARGAPLAPSADCRRQLALEETRRVPQELQEDYVFQTPVKRTPQYGYGTMLHGVQRCAEQNGRRPSSSRWSARKLPRNGSRPGSHRSASSMTPLLVSPIPRSNVTTPTSAQSLYRDLAFRCDIEQGTDGGGATVAQSLQTQLRNQELRHSSSRRQRSGQNYERDNLAYGSSCRSSSGGIRQQNLVLGVRVAALQQMYPAAHQSENGFTAGEADIGLVLERKRVRKRLRGPTCCGGKYHCELIAWILNKLASLERRGIHWYVKKLSEEDRTALLGAAKAAKPYLHAIHR